MRLNVITLACALLLAFGLSFGVGAGPVVDGDGDGIVDSLDNCSGVANTTQCDTDLDGYGNICDADTNNDYGVGPPDFGKFALAFGSTNELNDFNCDGGVGPFDFGVFATAFGGFPGPSGLGCAGDKTQEPCTGI
jgi:hypothetical protein